ncbi:MAG: DUF952 domain-containing protein [Rhizobiaceae bacterium]|nr:DUF952 domain-containing protein [Rhizobiaceae bacterium]
MTIYKIATKTQWAEAEKNRIFSGAPIDLSDGYIHFSTAAQARETVAKHFAGQSDLLLVSVDETMLGDMLKYEVSRGDQLFPHLYGKLSLEAVTEVIEMPLDSQGNHVFPADFPQ